MAHERDAIGMATAEDARRVRALRELDVLDKPVEERFDRVVRLAQQLFGVRTVGINLVDADRQFTKASVGTLPLGDMPRADSLCTFTVQADQTLEIPDTRADPVWAEHPAVVGELNVRFYAGAPLRAPGGERVGALCLIDEEPRTLTDPQRQVLRDLADWVEREMATSAELEEGRDLQRRLLPRRMPLVDGWEFAGGCVQAGAVGGDFYDVQQLPSTIQVLLADVMGKGLSAALIAAGVRAIVRGTSPHNTLTGSVARVAEDLAEDLDDAGSFATLFAARLDPGTGELEYVDAGHGLAFVIARSGEWRRLRSDALPVGTGVGDTWRSQTDRIAPGDALVVVSDGLLDVHSDINAMVADIARMLEKEANLRRAVELLVHSGSDDVGDDVTVVVARRTAIG